MFPIKVFTFFCLSGGLTLALAQVVPEPRHPRQVIPEPRQVTSEPPEDVIPEPRKTICNCGVRKESKRIVGGTEAVKNEFPWRCILVGQNMGPFCGGTIISKRWILTAAHCTRALNMTGHPNNVSVSCGDHDLSRIDEAKHQYIAVDKIKQNLNYNNKTQDQDISLLHLAEDLDFDNPNIMPVCLPWKGEGHDCEKSGTVVTASGWGTTKYNGSASLALRKVDLNCISTAQCQKYYKGKAVNDNMMCTLMPGKDTCQGDSGGSIDYKDPSSGRYFSIGIVSWGVKCAVDRKPGVYAKMTRFLDWIKKTTQDDSFCSPR